MARLVAAPRFTKPQPPADRGGRLSHDWWPDDQDVRHAKVWAGVGQSLGALLLAVALMAIYVE